MRETVREAQLIREVTKLGGLTVKLIGDAGIPDRLVLLPGGQVAFVETKSTTGIPSKRQKFWRQRLQALGFVYALIRTPAEIKGLLVVLKKTAAKNQWPEICGAGALDAAEIYPPLFAEPEGIPAAPVELVRKRIK